MPAPSYPTERDTNGWSVQLIPIAASLMVLCAGFAKLSLVCFYHRMSQLRWLRIASVAIGVFIVISSIALFCALTFSCTPLKATWDITIPGKCIDRTAVYVALAALNIITDVVLLIVPIPMVIKLQMPTVQKIGVTILFTLGSA